MMSRERAVELVTQHLSNKNLQKHVFAVEAVMRALAERYSGDPDVWGLAGLLHDLDYEQTLDDMERHGEITVAMLREEGGVGDDVLHAIRAHVGHVERESDMDRAIYCADPVTGFIVACALMHPAKKIAVLDFGFMERRFTEKRFAAGASREQMTACSELGLELEEFMLISRDAMASISKILGL